PADEARRAVRVEAARTGAAVVVANLRALTRGSQRAGEPETQGHQRLRRSRVGAVASDDGEPDVPGLIRVVLQDDALDAARGRLGAALVLPGGAASALPTDLGGQVDEPAGHGDVDGGVAEAVDELDEETCLRGIERRLFVDARRATDLDALVAQRVAELPQRHLGTLDVDACDCRARIARVADAVAVRVDLQRIRNGRAVVIGIADAVAVLVGDVQIVRARPCLSGTRLGRIAWPRRRTAHRARELEGAEGRAAVAGKQVAVVTLLQWIQLPVAADQRCRPMRH